MIRNDGYLVLIVGCGQLGSRHLQAIASMPQVANIEVLDSRPEALALGKERISELPDKSLSSHIRWLSTLDDVTPNGDLCIIATQSLGRCQLVKDVVSVGGYSSFLLEKIVSQSASEMEGLIQFSVAKNLSVWVNCQSRVYPIHQKAKRLLGTGEPLNFLVSGGNHGLASNGIHHADLFSYYDDAEFIDSAGFDIHSLLHPSKRGADMFDLSGTLHGRTDKGSTLVISYAADHQEWEHLSIGNSHHRFFVDHLSETVLESDAESGWQWRRVPFEGSTLVSKTTQDIAANILCTGTCALPTLEESLVSHRFILGELQSHFSKLTGKNLDCCPVT